ALPLLSRNAVGQSHPVSDRHSDPDLREVGAPDSDDYAVLFCFLLSSGTDASWPRIPVDNRRDRAEHMARTKSVHQVSGEGYDENAASSRYRRDFPDPRQP